MCRRRETANRPSVQSECADNKKPRHTRASGAVIRFLLLVCQAAHRFLVAPDALDAALLGADGSGAEESACSGPARGAAYDVHLAAIPARGLQRGVELVMVAAQDDGTVVGQRKVYVI